MGRNEIIGARVQVKTPTEQHRRANDSGGQCHIENERIARLFGEKGAIHDS